MITSGHLIASLGCNEVMRRLFSCDLEETSTDLQLSRLVDAVDDVPVVLEVELRLGAQLAAEVLSHV